MMTENDKAAVMACYQEVTFYPAAEQNYDWLAMVFSRYFEGPLSIADPFCGSATMTLASIINGHRVSASDISPLSEMFIATILADPSYFFGIDYQTLECQDGSGNQVIEQIMTDTIFNDDVASHYALLYCANGLLQGKNITSADFVQCQSKVYELSHTLAPYKDALRDLLAYQTRDIATTAIDSKVDMVFFDPPYFQRGSFKQALQPLLNFMGNNAALEDDNFLNDEALYQQRLCQWLKVCFGALKEDGMLLLTVSAQNELQCRQMFKACERMNLAIHTDYYRQQPFLYCIKSEHHKNKRNIHVDPGF